MKKTLISSFIALFLLGATASAQVKTETGATPKDTPVTQADQKKAASDALAAKKVKIEADLRDTAAKLKLVIGRTQVLIDLLAKNGKDTTEAQSTLLSAQASLEEATLATDQFAGIFPQTKTADAPKEETTPLLKTMKTKEVVVLKDPLKKAQDSLKDAKAFLISSIGILKDGLAQKESSN